MRLTMELKVIGIDDKGDTVVTREPTAEEYDEFLSRFVKMEDAAQDRADGTLWLLDLKSAAQVVEEFDFTNPIPEKRLTSCGKRR